MKTRVSSKNPSVFGAYVRDTSNDDGLALVHPTVLRGKGGLTYEPMHTPTTPGSKLSLTPTRIRNALVGG